MQRERPRCPTCGSDDTQEIIYGLPDPDQREALLGALQRGEVIPEDGDER
jgi:hypothetical protein